MPSKTMSIRIDKEKYDFVKRLAREEKEDLSSAVRVLIDKGRIHLALEEYKKGSASLGRAADLAGVPLSEMMDTLAEYGVEARLDKEDYLAGLENLKRIY